MRLASSKSIWSLAVLVTAVMYRKVAIDYLKTNKKIFSMFFFWFYFCNTSWLLKLKTITFKILKLFAV